MASPREVLEFAQGPDPRPLLVVLSGAGISAESGIPTFRDANGLWEGHDVMEVASPLGWARNPELVLRFYNLRREAAAKAQPNEGHLQLARLQQHLRVVVVTQNVDDLHERAGSQHVLHLHGLLREVRSTGNPSYVADVGSAPIALGDLCPQGHQLRPNIVWFGEEVPMMEFAARIASRADFMAVVGTSMVVYPAAGLVEYAPDTCPVFVINPQRTNVPLPASRLTWVQEPATTGVHRLSDWVLSKLTAA